MGQQGRLTRWDDARGFVFITPLAGGPDVFVHIHEFPRDRRSPELLDLLTYSVERDDRMRVHATGVTFLTPTRAASRVSAAPQAGATHKEGLPGALAAAAAFFAALIALVALGAAPAVVLGLDVFLSAALLAFYWLDKAAAQSGRWRAAESGLHLLALAGGWPGALVAQRLFRHKTRKQPFQTVYWATVAGNCLILLVVVWAQSSAAPG